ncbi:MAG: alanine racemase [Candidatus Pacebacteria bacterium]|nr:alanine racemase [Candidatus Paceibacterota bacterium]
MSRVWADINCDRWAANFRAIKEAVAPAVVVPVIKSDCYGLGAHRAATVFRQAGARRFAVATLEEARALADVGCELQILGAPMPEEISAMVKNDIVISVPDMSTARLIGNTAAKLGRIARVHVLIDSGMGRLGTLLPEALETIRTVAALPYIDVEGVYSHLPAAEVNDASTHNQVEQMTTLMRDLTKQGVDIRYRHLANSSAAGGLPASAREPFNMVRPGIDLHGAGSPDVMRSYHLEPVLTLKSRLAAVRRLPAGFTVGYGRTYKLTETQLVGTIPVGYADGYPYSLSNKGQVLIRGRRCPIIGSVCMDYSQVLLDDVPDAEVGDDVVLIGTQGKARITIQEVAETAGTITYEILTGLGRRVERRYC